MADVLPIPGSLLDRAMSDEQACATYESVRMHVQAEEAPFGEPDSIYNGLTGLTTERTFRPELRQVRVSVVGAEGWEYRAHQIYLLDAFHPGQIIWKPSDEALNEIEAWVPAHVVAEMRGEVV